MQPKDLVHVPRFVKVPMVDEMVPLKRLSSRINVSERIVSYSDDEGYAIIDNGTYEASFARSSSQTE